MNDDLIETLIKELHALVEELKFARDGREAILHAVNQITDHCQLQMKNQIQEHTLWINRVIADATNTLTKAVRDLTDANKKWVGDEMREWREGESQKIQKLQVEAQHKVADALMKMADPEADEPWKKGKK